MANIQIAELGVLQGDADKLKNFRILALAEVMAAYDFTSVTKGRHKERTIENGKAADFPCIGRASAAFLKPGMSLDDIRQNIPNQKRTIYIDGLLTSNQLIADIEEAMLHYDVRGEYTKQMGVALARAEDGGVLAEIAKEAVADKENITGLGKGGIVTRTRSASISDGEQLYQMLLEIKTKMTNNLVPHDGRVIYVKPEMIQALLSSKEALDKRFGSTFTIIDGKLTKLAGFDLVETPHLTIGGTDDGNVLQGGGHVFPELYKDTCMFLAAHEDTVGILRLKGVALEHARRAEYQADMLISKMAIGIGGLRPEAAFLGELKTA